MSSFVSCVQPRRRVAPFLPRARGPSATSDRAPPPPPAVGRAGSSTGWPGGRRREQRHLQRARQPAPCLASSHGTPACTKPSRHHAIGLRCGWVHGQDVVTTPSYEWTKNENKSQEEAPPYRPIAQRDVVTHGQGVDGAQRHDPTTKPCVFPLPRVKTLTDPLTRDSARIPARF